MTDDGLSEMFERARLCLHRNRPVVNGAMCPDCGQTVYYLCEADWDQFVETMNNPGPPSQSMIDAAKQHRALPSPRSKPSTL